MIFRKTFLLFLSGLFLLGCDQTNFENTETSLIRWYAKEDVLTGADLFKTHCASCHGEEAQGLIKEWMRRDEAGNYPAPPLNGTAHAWHHPLAVLDRVITDGGLPLGGTMPGFSSHLSAKERAQVIAYFQSFWDEDIYEKWEIINNQ